jgi:hypothetical protein
MLTKNQVRGLKAVAGFGGLQVFSGFWRVPEEVAAASYSP